MIDERVKEMLKEREWSFVDLQDINSVVKNFAETLYDELSAKEKLDLVWHVVGEDFQRLVMTSLRENVADIMKVELIHAKINFNEDDNNEVSERSLGGEPHKECSSDEATDSEE